MLRIRVKHLPAWKTHPGPSESTPFWPSLSSFPPCQTRATHSPHHRNPTCFPRSMDSALLQESFPDYSAPGSLTSGPRTLISRPALPFPSATRDLVRTPVSMKKALLQVPRSPEHNHSTHKSPVGALLNEPQVISGRPASYLY